MNQSRILANRKTEFDLVRIIAILFVIYNHVHSGGYYYFTSFFDVENGMFTSWKFWPLMAISILCKIAVPLFFMISGALLLGREEDYRTIFRHRVLKYGIVLLVFSAFYFLVDKRYTTKEIMYFFIIVYSRGINPQFWFVYAYISFLLVLPFLRKLAKGMEYRDFCYLFILAFVFQCIIPIFQYVATFDNITLSGHLSVGSLIGTGVLYPLLGYGLTKYPLSTKMKERFIEASVILLVLVMLLTGYHMRKYVSIEQGLFEKFWPCCTVIHTLTVYVVLCDLVSKHKLFQHQKVKAVLAGLGKCVFGVYLFHMAALQYLAPCYDAISTFLPPYPACWVFVLMVFVVCTGLTYILKKIPGINRLL